MTAQFDDELWEDLPLDLDLDFDADEDPDAVVPRPQLPPGHHLVVRWRGRVASVRVAVDLRDIAEWNG